MLVHDLFQETSLSIEQQVRHAAVGKAFHPNRVFKVRLKNGVKSYPIAKEISVGHTGERGFEKYQKDNVKVIF